MAEDMKWETADGRDMQGRGAASVTECGIPYPKYPIKALTAPTNNKSKSTDQKMTDLDR